MFIFRRKNFEKSDEYKRAYGKKDELKGGNASKGKTNNAQSSSEPHAEGGYIQR